MSNRRVKKEPSPPARFRIFCDTTWVHLGSINCQTPWKTVLYQVCRAKTNQRDSKLESNYEPEGREFESPRARHFPTVRPGDMGDTTYLRHR